MQHGGAGVNSGCASFELDRLNSPTVIGHSKCAQFEVCIVDRSLLTVHLLTTQ